MKNESATQRLARRYRQSLEAKPLGLPGRSTPNEGGKSGEPDTTIAFKEWAEARGYTATTRAYA